MKTTGNVKALVGKTKEQGAIARKLTETSLSRVDLVALRLANNQFQRKKSAAAVVHNGAVYREERRSGHSRRVTRAPRFLSVSPLRLIRIFPRGTYNYVQISACMAETTVSYGTNVSLNFHGFTKIGDREIRSEIFRN